jgi:hypothetical protein
VFGNKWYFKWQATQVVKCLPSYCYHMLLLYLPGSHSCSHACQVLKAAPIPVRFSQQCCWTVKLWMMSCCAWDHAFIIRVKRTKKIYYFLLYLSLKIKALQSYQPSTIMTWLTQHKMPEDLNLSAGNCNACDMRWPLHILPMDRLATQRFSFSHFLVSHETV